VAYEGEVRSLLGLFNPMPHNPYVTVRVCGIAVKEIVMTKLVTDNQGREVARLARTVDLPRASFQTALTNGTIKKFLLGLMLNPLEYPDWVRQHLTPEYEVKGLADPGVVQLWLDPRQGRGNPFPTGHEVYEAIRQENLLSRSLSYGHLKWLEENPDRIPVDWHQRRLWVYAWGSVVRVADGGLGVPCLDCDVPKPYVDWHWLGDDWRGGEPAGLRK
jgi:hypothetical protein